MTKLQNRICYAYYDLSILKERLLYDKIGGKLNGAKINYLSCRQHLAGISIGILTFC